MNKSCSMHGNGKACIQHFLLENLKGRDLSEDPDILTTIK